jgi:hypothetical protein
MDPNPRPHPVIIGLSRHDYKKRLGPDAFERLEILGGSFQPGAGVRLSDNRTGEWTTHAKDVTVISQSRIVVERAVHGDARPKGGPDEDPTGPVPAALRVTVTCPDLPPVTNSFTIAFLD